jgi:hypothetical protein
MAAPTPYDIIAKGINAIPVINTPLTDGRKAWTNRQKPTFNHPKPRVPHSSNSSSVNGDRCVVVVVGEANIPPTL